MIPEAVNLQEKFNSFDDHWALKLVGELNGQQLNLVKISGEFEWHSHEHEDKMFLVTKGTLLIRFRDGAYGSERQVNAGEFIIVPRGIEHQPVAETDEAWLMLLEPAAGTTLPD